jgi:3-deoxy-D-manno-octulosonate 8-phosphate phosphatase (KDO 8-P phosphatase)
MPVISEFELEVRLGKVQLLLLDVDGVLTDGSLYYGPDGEALKRFHVKDGHGIVMWRVAGGRTGILSARTSGPVTARARELRLDPVLQGQKDKAQGFAEALRLTGLTAEQVCYVGDDTNDLAPLSLCGVAVAPADACPEARAAAHWVTSVPGGQGAVREVTERLLKAQGKWAGVLEVMQRPPTP